MMPGISTIFKMGIASGENVLESRRLKAGPIAEIFLTMSVKILGTISVICQIEEVQNPFPLTTMLFNRHMTSILG